MSTYSGTLHGSISHIQSIASHSDYFERSSQLFSNPMLKELYHIGKWVLNKKQIHYMPLNSTLKTVKNINSRNQAPNILTENHPSLGKLELLM